MTAAVNHDWEQLAKTPALVEKDIIGGDGTYSLFLADGHYWLVPQEGSNPHYHEPLLCEVDEVEVLEDDARQYGEVVIYGFATDDQGQPLGPMQVCNIDQWFGRD